VDWGERAVAETEEDGDGGSVGKAVGEGGLDVEVAAGGSCGEATAAADDVDSKGGATVPLWHAASRLPSAPRPKPTNLRRDRDLPKMVNSFLPLISLISSLLIMSS
jgi:hypothetical protein